MKPIKGWHGAVFTKLELWPIGRLGRPPCSVVELAQPVHIAIGKLLGKMNTHAKQRVPAQVPGKESLDDSSLDSESQRPQENEIVGLADREN